MIRKKGGWELLEAKSSKKLKPEHIPDIAIQSFIVRKCMKQLGTNLTAVKLIHINGDFTLKEEDNYEGLINDENNITRKVIEEEEKIPKYIKDFILFTNRNSPCPEKEMGNHCKKPYDCDYQNKCKSLLAKSDITPFTILPYIGKDERCGLIEFMKSQGTTDLQKVPSKFFRDRKGYAPGYHKIIQDAHKNNEPWFSENLKNILKKFNFPFYFMDFEHVGQVVPIIKGTQPYFRLPFQWSVYKWESLDKKIKQGKEKSFLDFDDQNIERKFVEKLLKAVGKDGTIFAHSADTVEISILNELKEKDNCKDFADKIDNLIKRTTDTNKLVRENFYHPKMNGDYRIKSIIKVMPHSGISYEEKDNIEGGDDAQLAWFIYTNPKTSKKEQERQIKLLIDYCSKDTLAVYHLVKYLMENMKDKKN